MTTTVTYPRHAAVRITTNGAVHAGYLTTTPGRYAALCPAGKGYQGDHGPYTVKTGDPVDGPVTCRTCVRRYELIVNDLHARHHAGRVEAATAATRRTRATAAPTGDDDAQVANGTRPPAGVLVTVDGHTRPFVVIKRSPIEQGNAPDRIRVQQVGHTFNGSVALADVRPVHRPRRINPVRGWQPVILTEYDADQGDGCGEYAVSDAVTGAYVGQVWHNARGEWSAYRLGSAGNGRLPSGPCVSLHAALSAVQWLPTTPADQVTPGTRLVLADGTRVAVDAVTTTGDQVTLTVSASRLRIAVGGRIKLVDPHPVGPMRATVTPTSGCADQGDRITYTLTVPPCMPVTLVPACHWCNAPAGVPCAPGCP